MQVNYRTSHQIRKQADFLLNPEVTDVDGNSEVRKGTISVFNGPLPEIKIFDSEKDECNGVIVSNKALVGQGLSLHEIGIFVRSAKEIDRAIIAAKVAGYPFVLLDETVDTISNKVAISTMHLAKGLEFKAVVVMACDEEVIPSQERIENISDSADLEDVYSTERHLLYVACTRARDYLLVTCSGSPSEFLQDLKMAE